MPITSPAGPAIWPDLITPRAFDNKGPESYSAKIRLDMKDEKAQKFINELEEAVEAGKVSIQEWRAKKGEKPLTPAQLKKSAPLPFVAEEDDEGEPTGYWTVKGKLKALRTYNGESIEQRPMLFDESGKEWDLDKSIWSGSTIRISVNPVPYFVAALGYGISLQLKAVQVIDAVSHSDIPKDAKSFGFDVSAPTESTEVVEESAFDSAGFDDL